VADTLYLDDARDAVTGAIRGDLVSTFAANNLKRGTDHIVFVGAIDLDQLEAIVGELKRYAINLLFAPTSKNRRLKLLDVVAIGPNNAVRFMRAPLSDAAVLFKRFVDLSLATIGLIILSPLLLLVALAIKLDSRGPVIFRQARRGFNGQSFMIWKFRSMTVTESGFGMTQAKRGDARFTRVGRFIRATSIDELPQLVNVFLGQMSLVGPRPHAISHDEALSRQLADYASRQRIKPGITGWAQVNGFRGETVSAEQIEGRVAYDMYYIDNWSIYFDLWIMLRTVVAVVIQRDAF
jgi:exopolysaccharide biosynthesis polyprenyl glycosylphosphotransferase